MGYSRPAGIIAQQIREIAGQGKDPARPHFLPQFLPDLCSVSALAALVLMGELLALVLVLAVDGLHPFNWQRLGLVSLAVQWVILPSAALLCRLRPRLAKLSHKLAGGLSFAAVLAVVLAVTTAQEWWSAELVAGPFDTWRWLGNSLLGAICAGVVLRYAYVQQQLRNQQQAELGARIEALQSRIRPHFLFNSMNSLASLIAVDPERAEKLVEDLSALFRASLAEPKLVPLAQELELARRYLAIEALRLGERLQSRWEIGDCPDSAQLPAMLLQPLLENAVLHGVARLREGGEIVVRLHARDGQLELGIENPLPPEDAEPNRNGNGMAMDNIRQRLAAHYGDRFWFSAAAEGDRYRVQLRIPVEARTQHSARQHQHQHQQQQQPEPAL